MIRFLLSIAIRKEREREKNNWRKRSLLKTYIDLHLNLCLIWGWSWMLKILNVQTGGFLYLFLLNDKWLVAVRNEIFLFFFFFSLLASVLCQSVRNSFFSSFQTTKKWMWEKPYRSRFFFILSFSSHSSVLSLSDSFFNILINKIW